MITKELHVPFSNTFQAFPVPCPGDDEDRDGDDDDEEEKVGGDSDRILRDYRYKLQCQLMAADRNLKAILEEWGNPSLKYFVGKH